MRHSKAMMLKSIETPDDLEQALAESDERPVWILKHSDECGLSERAYQAFLAHRESSSVPHWILVVQQAPALSRKLADLVGIRHETPQVLYLSNRHVEWTASHRAITLDALAAASS